MKKEIFKKTKVIAGVVAACVVILAGVGIYKMVILPESKASAVVVEETTEPEMETELEEICVPEITVMSETGPVEPTADSVGEPKTEEVAKVPETEAVTTKESAVPPEPPVVEEEENLTDSSKEPAYSEEAVKPNPSSDTPKHGDIREDGAMYVDGFGWVPYSGENSYTVAPNMGTGEIIGDM